jgi:uncharacterized protein (DUF1778 family)
MENVMDTNRTARIEARITVETLAVVKRAAEIEGRSLSDFIVTATRNAARKTIEDSQVLHLSLQDQRHFIDMVLDPPQPVAALRRAKAAHDDLIDLPQ